MNNYIILKYFSLKIVLNLYRFTIHKHPIFKVQAPFLS